MLELPAKCYTEFKGMSYTVTEESFESLDSLQSDPDTGLNWSSVFVLPVWMKVWWQIFGSGAELYLRALREGNEVIGVAPLFIREGTASIVGGADVCDYLDFVVVPGREEDFFNVLLDDLKGNGVNRLYLESLRPDSTVLTSLAGIAENRRCEVDYQKEDISLDLDLPATWEEYLGLLTSKQRHEVRRKLRRLQEAGKVNYHIVEEKDDIWSNMGIFFQMFTESKDDKAVFLTERMESFFRLLAGTLADTELIKLGILELDLTPTAMIIYFDYRNGIYLYNSGYNPKYNSLSVGLLSKVLCIKESIEGNRKKFDFLKGDEVYKYRLGGKEIPLYSCRINIK